MANLNVNKVIYGGDVLIDLTGDSVSADKILKGITAHDKSGAKITGTCTFDSDTSEDTAAVAEILVGKTAHARGSKLTGTMSGSEDMKPQSKEVTPSKEAQTIMPDEEYNCLSQVTVKAIPYVETDNSAGGKTVTIG